MGEKIGVISGRSSTTEFGFDVEGKARKFDYISIKHQDDYEVEIVPVLLPMPDESAWRLIRDRGR